jgi:AcrR family transcriptional regulator
MPGRTNARLLTDSIAEIFREEGYDGASLSLLATRTGLGKASLYHHFPGGKADMADAVYDRVSAAFTREVLARLAGREAPEERLKRMADGLDRFYDGGRRACLIDVFSIGGVRGGFHGKLTEAVNYWVTAIARTLVDAGFGREPALQRAEDAVIAIEGALVVARATGRPEAFQRTVRALPERLLAD